MTLELALALFLISSVIVFFWYAEEKTQSVKLGEDGRKCYHRRDPHRYNSVLPKKKTEALTANN